MGKWLIWVADQRRQGWACAQCEWSFPVPALLTDPEARDAYDRLAAAKFREHDCTQHTAPAGPVEEESFAERARKLVAHGFKPKDAVAIILQETMLEHHNKPAIVERARADAEDFLRRVREGLI